MKLKEEIEDKDSKLGENLKVLCNLKKEVCIIFIKKLNENTSNFFFQ